MHTGVKKKRITRTSLCRAVSLPGMDRLFSVPMHRVLSLPTALPHCAPQRHQRRQRALLLGDGHLVVGTALNATGSTARAASSLPTSSPMARPVWMMAE